MKADVFTNIHPNAQIADDVQIGSFTVIQDNVTIDSGTIIENGVTIMSGARIGKNCHIFPGAVISAIPQDLKFKGEETTAEVGDNTTIRECVTINRGTAAKGKTIVGNHCLLMAYVHIAHDCAIGDYVILGNATQIAGEVEIDDWAIISGGSLVHQFCRIGKHIMIQGGSKVGKDVPPYVTAGREPLAFFGINSVGLRRRRFSSEQVEGIQNVYRYIYQKGLNNSDALELIGKELPSTPECDEIINFIKASERGIIKG